MNPADLTLNTSPTLVSRALSTTQSIAAKNAKAAVPRVDVEPIYTQLKGALGEQWEEYKAAVNAFVLGHLNQAELSWVLQPVLSSAQPATTPVSAFALPTSTLRLHNTLIAAVYANTIRDAPPSDVAPWVVATDQPNVASKSTGTSGANDKAEERLKTEVMAIHARDRRRVKSLKESGTAVNEGFADMQNYKRELAIKPPDITSQSAGGITKTNWDLEIRRRYAQTLAEETLEFPSQSDMQNRIEPICYEEGVVGGAPQAVLQSCAEMMEHATEVFLKELLSQLCAHARSNGEGCVQTNKFKRRFRKEEEGAEQGIIHRNPSGLLPVEMEVQAKREPLDMQDMRLAVQLHDTFLKRGPFLSERIMLNRHPDLTSPAPKTNGIVFPTPVLNGNGPKSDMMDVGNEDAEDAEWGWRGAAKVDTDDLMGVLDECLARV